MDTERLRDSASTLPSRVDLNVDVDVGSRMVTFRHREPFAINETVTVVPFSAIKSLAGQLLQVEAQLEGQGFIQFAQPVVNARTGSQA